MADFIIPEKPVYNSAIQKLEPTNRGHADVFNAVFQAVINNIAYLKKEADAPKVTYNAISNTEIDALGNLSPLPGGPDVPGTGCTYDSITPEDIQKIVDTIVANGNAGGGTSACQCASITPEEIQAVIAEMRRTGQL